MWMWFFLIMLKYSYGSSLWLIPPGKALIESDKGGEPSVCFHFRLFDFPRLRFYQYGLHMTIKQLNLALLFFGTRNGSSAWGSMLLLSRVPLIRCNKWDVLCKCFRSSSWSVRQWGKSTCFVVLICRPTVLILGTCSSIWVHAGVDFNPLFHFKHIG